MSKYDLHVPMKIVLCLLKKSAFFKNCVQPCLDTGFWLNKNFEKSLVPSIIVKISVNINWRWHVAERNFTEFAMNTIELAVAVQTALFISKSQKHTCTHLPGHFECPRQNSDATDILCPQIKIKTMSSLLDNSKQE